MTCDHPEAAADGRVGSRKAQLPESKPPFRKDPFRSAITAEDGRSASLLEVNLLQRETFRSLKVDAVGLTRRQEQLLDLVLLSRIRFSVFRTGAASSSSLRQPV